MSKWFIEVYHKFILYLLNTERRELILGHCVFVFFMQFPLLLRMFISFNNATYFFSPSYIFLRLFLRGFTFYFSFLSFTFFRLFFLFSPSFAFSRLYIFDIISYYWIFHAFTVISVSRGIHTFSEKNKLLLPKSVIEFTERTPLRFSRRARTYSDKLVFIRLRTGLPAKSLSGLVSRGCRCNKWSAVLFRFSFREFVDIPTRWHFLHGDGAAARRRGDWK